MHSTVTCRLAVTVILQALSSAMFAATSCLSNVLVASQRIVERRTFAAIAGCANATRREPGPYHLSPVSDSGPSAALRSARTQLHLQRHPYRWNKRQTKRS